MKYSLDSYFIAKQIVYTSLMAPFQMHMLLY